MILRRTFGLSAGFRLKSRLRQVEPKPKVPPNERPCNKHGQINCTRDMCPLPEGYGYVPDSAIGKSDGRLFLSYSNNTALMRCSCCGQRGDHWDIECPEDEKQSFYKVVRYDDTNDVPSCQETEKSLAINVKTSDAQPDNLTHHIEPLKPEKKSVMGDDSSPQDKPQTSSKQKTPNAYPCNKHGKIGCTLDMCPLPEGYAYVVDCYSYDSRGRSVWVHSSDEIARAICMWCGEMGHWECECPQPSDDDDDVPKPNCNKTVVDEISCQETEKSLPIDVNTPDAQLGNHTGHFEPVTDDSSVQDEVQTSIESEGPKGTVDSKGAAGTNKSVTHTLKYKTVTWCPAAGSNNKPMARKRKYDVAMSCESTQMCVLAPPSDASGTDDKSLAVKRICLPAPLAAT